MGDKAGARKSYQNFLTLWKDADPDIPIYQQAKADMQSCSSCNPGRHSRTTSTGEALDGFGRAWLMDSIASCAT